MRKNQIITGALIIVALVLVSGTAYMLGSNQNSTDGGSREVETNKNVSQKNHVDNAKLVNPGEVAEYATLNLIVNDAKASKQVVHYGNSYVADAGTKFLIVDITVTNTTDMPFNANSFGLLDDHNVYIDSVRGQPADAAEDAIIFQTLNPNVPTHAVDIFVIPEDMTATNYGSINANTDQFVGVKLSF